jgi:hypothetical protein
LLVVVGGLMAWYLPVVTESLDPASGEGQPSGAATPLAVQDPGDSSVGVVHGKPADQFDGPASSGDARWTSWSGRLTPSGTG